MVGLLAFADFVKSNSCQAILQLKSLGLTTVMLIGDNQQTADSVGRQLGLDRIVAEVLPGDKVEEVKRLLQEGGRVLMVGDGINDAPARISSSNPRM